MSITVVCSQCGRSYNFSDDLAGQTDKCACGAFMIIPTAIEHARLPGQSIPPGVESPCFCEHRQSERPSEDSVQTTNRMAITSLAINSWTVIGLIVCGIILFIINTTHHISEFLSSLMLIMLISMVVTGISGPIAGIYAICQIRASTGRQKGLGMAISSTGIGCIGILLTLICVALFIMFGVADTTSKFMGAK